MTTTIKGISNHMFDFISKADKQQLLKMERELTQEINEGLLVATQYHVELRLIQSRLA